MNKLRKIITIFSMVVVVVSSFLFVFPVKAYNGTNLASITSMWGTEQNYPFGSSPSPLANYDTDVRSLTGEETIRFNLPNSHGGWECDAPYVFPQNGFAVGHHFVFGVWIKTTSDTQGDSGGIRLGVDFYSASARIGAYQSYANYGPHQPEWNPETGQDIGDQYANICYWGTSTWKLFVMDFIIPQYVVCDGASNLYNAGDLVTPVFAIPWVAPICSYAYTDTAEGWLGDPYIYIDPSGSPDTTPTPTPVSTPTPILTPTPIGQTPSPIPTQEPILTIFYNDNILFVVTIITVSLTATIYLYLKMGRRKRQRHWWYK